MNDYIIAIASTADLPLPYLEQHQIPFISYTYSVNDTIIVDDCKEESRQAAYAAMRHGDVYSTAMINAQVYSDFFKRLLDTGKDVIFLDMSKEMSSSYHSGQQAAEEIRTKYPNQTLYSMDTRCISGGLGLLVEQMVQRKESGVNFNDLVAWGEANKLKIMHRFTVDDLNYLKRGGRVSNASAMVGSLLSIKPVLYVPNDGSLTVSSKARGRKAAITALLDGMKRDIEQPDGQVIHINHADCLEDAETLRSMIFATWPTVADVTISNLGVTIGAHCGPGLLTVFYFGKERMA